MRFSDEGHHRSTQIKRIEDPAPSVHSFLTAMSDPGLYFPFIEKTKIASISIFD